MSKVFLVLCAGIIFSFCFLIPIVQAAEELIDAVKAKKLNQVEKLLTSNADVNIKDEKGMTPLHWASALHNYKMAKLLLNHQADVNVKDNDGVTPLLWAFDLRCQKMMKLFLDHQANANVKLEGSPLLHRLIRILNGNHRIKLLIKYHVDINATDLIGNTPLHVAIRRGNKKVVKLLLDNNANVNAINVEGFTPLDVAKKYGASRHHEIQWLQERGAVSGETLLNSRSVASISSIESSQKGVHRLVSHR